jgi:ribosomal protein S12 methylthiotransferase accessory factor
MLQRPRFKPHYYVEVVEGEGVFVVSEAEQTVLQGRLYEQVAVLLDGRPVAQLCESLGPALSPARIFYTLNRLEQKGFLCEADGGGPSELSGPWSAQGLEPATAARRLAAARARVDGAGMAPDALRELLVSQCVTVAEDADLRVVAADHYLRRELKAANADALRSGRPWLLVKASGAQVWLGPLFVPGKTGCWECLARRLRANCPVLGYLDQFHAAGLPAVVRGQSPATQAVAWGLAAHAVAAWAAHGQPPANLEGKIRTLDLHTWEWQTHNLLRLPSCPACGRAGDQAARPVVLESRRKTYTEDGGHRARIPQETLDRYGHLVSPVCGAVTLLQSVTPANADAMHVYVSGHNVARAPASLRQLKVDLRNSSCGKGATALQARASALCEGLERYSGQFQGDEPRRRARFHELSDAALHPNACMLFSDDQYRRRQEENARRSLFHQVPEPFDPDAEIEWTPVWSLTHERVRYLPTSFCYFDYPHDNVQDFCVGCSNGNAAGNTLEEAVLQGFLELVERDSVALWWYNCVPAPGVDLDSFREPYLGQLRDCLARHGRDLWALDLTSDLGIPAYAALSRRAGGRSEQILFGFGAHLDTRIALLRAVTELNQMLAPLLGLPADELPAHLTDEDTLAWLRNARLEEHRYLAPGEGRPRTAADHPRVWAEDLKEDILWCRARVEALGLEVLVLDHTRPEIGLPVVKVMVPGLRHFWPRFAPGRLYDVPVKLGWRTAPLVEGELNPTPMFL